MDLRQNTQRYQEILSAPLPICTIIMVIKVMCQYWCRSFGCNSNPHCQFFFCINKLRLLNFGVIPPLKFQLLCAMIMTRKLTISWVKNMYFCPFATKTCTQGNHKKRFWICNCFWKTVVYFNVLTLLTIEDSLCCTKVSNMKKFTNIYYI